MAGPWELYQTPEGPWTQYATQATQALDTPPAQTPQGADKGWLDASNRGLLQGLTLSFGDELMAGALTPIEMGVRAYRGEDWSPGASYDAALARERADNDAARSAYPVASGIGQLAGGLVSGGGLASSGLSAGARAAQSGAGLSKVAFGSAVDGAALGAATGFGEGEGGLGNRIGSATTGGAAGLAVGAAAPLAIAGASAAARPMLAPILSRLRPQGYTDDALAASMRRAGMTPDDVAASMRAAQADGQDGWMVADALGETGQRQLSIAARNPNDARQGVINALDERQAGQGRRVSAALADAFDAPDTAAARAASLTAARDSAADISYAAAREGAGPVDVSGAVARIDEVLQPGISRIASPQTQIADDSVEGALLRARRLLTDGRSNLSGFDAILRAKQDIDDMIGRAVRSGAGNQARLLMGVKQELDGALSAASGPYAAARDAFARGSRAIEAVDTGRAAAMRGRADDTIPAFNAMSASEQSAFRAGYADPLIESTQSAAYGVNKVRPLLNDATAAEFPAFATHGRGDQLLRRLDRENTMFATRAEALGNSKTAQRLADDADFAQFDPNAVMSLLRGRPLEAGMQAVSKVLNEAKGQNPEVVARIARVLLGQDPVEALSALSQAYRQRAVNQKTKEAIRAMILGVFPTVAAGP